MKRLLTIVFFFLFVLLSFDCSAVWVKGYYRKNGTYVAPHYRSATRSRGGYGAGYYTLPAVTAAGAAVAATAAADGAVSAEETVTHEKLAATPAQDNALNQKWLGYYKSAAMIVGDLSNLGKVEYICKFQETTPFWEAVENQYSFCYDRGCFVEWMTKNHVWPDLNQKINNIYKYLKEAEEGR